MTARLTNSDPYGNRWSTDRTIRVTPQYVEPHPVPWTGTRPRVWRYEIYDTLAQAHRYARTYREAVVAVTEALAARDAYRLAWGEWEIFGDAWRCFSSDEMIELRVGRSQDVNHAGLYGVGILGCGPVRGWLSNIRHPEARRLNLIAHAEYLNHKETT